MNFYYIEVTDKVNNKPAFSWVERYCIQATKETVVRRAKKEIGWNGVRCNRMDCGRTIKLTPRGLDQIAFIHSEA